MRGPCLWRPVRHGHKRFRAPPDLVRRGSGLRGGDRMTEYEELADWLTTKVAGYLNVPRDTIDVDAPLADCGIDSVSAMSLCTDLQCEKGFDVETTIVYDYVTIGGIAAFLAAEQVVP